MQGIKKTVLFLLIWGGLLGVGLFWVYTRNADFPFWYHWDEGGKAAQVISGTRNMNHPQLLLNGAALLERMVRPGSGDLQHVTQLGRIASAFFTAGAVVLLSWTAFWVAGGWGAVLTAGLVGFHPHVFELSHYFKEDTALMFGWAAVLFAAGVMLRYPRRSSALLLGFVCGLAVSGKYAGVFVALPALGLVVIAYRRFADLTLAALAGTFALINFQAIRDPGLAVERIQRELLQQMENATHLAPPWEMAWADLGLAGLVLWVVCLAVWWHPGEAEANSAALGERERRALLLLALTAQLSYFAGLCMITRMNARYMLMVDVTTWWVTGIGLGRALAAVSLRKQPVLTLAGWLLLLGLAGVRGQKFGEEWVRFSSADTRVRMAKQLEDHVKPGDLLLMDILVRLPGTYAPQRDIGGWVPEVKIRPIGLWSAEMGEDMFETLLAEGVTLVMVTPDEVNRRLEAPADAEVGRFRDVRWRQPFYRRLFAEGTLLLQEEGHPGTVRSPPLLLYRIAYPAE